MSARLAAEPNATPMIDVLLVLLVTFLMALPVLRHTIDVQLPQPGGHGDDAQIALTLQRDGSFDLNGERIADEAVLGRRLREVYAGRPVRILFVLAPGDIRYERVIAAMDSARGAGVKVLGVTPTPPARGGAPRR